jgi:hypothetical protein
MYEYERATYNRVKARFAGQQHSIREELRQEAYHCNARARATIGQVAILCDEAVRDQLEDARKAIGRYNHADTEPDLRHRHDAVRDGLEAALRLARGDLAPERP